MAKAETALIAIAYRYFPERGRDRSVRAAARKLNVAASAISRQLIQLEESLGVALFDRSGRGLTLAPAGAILMRSLREAAQGHETALDELSALKGLKRGLLRLATVESVSVSILPDMLLEFAEAYPGLEVSVTVTGSDAVTGLVREHQADLGFTFNPSSLEGLTAVAARDLQLGAIMSSPLILWRNSRNSSSPTAPPIRWPGHPWVSASAPSSTVFPPRGSSGRPSNATRCASWLRWRGAAAASPSRR